MKGMVMAVVVGMMADIAMVMVVAVGMIVGIAMVVVLVSEMGMAMGLGTGTGTMPEAIVMVGGRCIVGRHTLGVR